MQLGLTLWFFLKNSQWTLTLQLSRNNQILATYSLILSQKSTPLWKVFIYFISSSKRHSPVCHKCHKFYKVNKWQRRVHLNHPMLLNGRLFHAPFPWKRKWRVTLLIPCDMFMSKTSSRRGMPDGNSRIWQRWRLFGNPFRNEWLTWRLRECIYGLIRSVEIFLALMLCEIHLSTNLVER